MLSTETRTYTTTAKVLHWIIALAIIFMLALGWSFDYFTGETKFALFQLHKSLGITILGLSLCRLAWRVAHQAPPLPATMALWEQRAAHFGHFLLYSAMICMPLSGWALVSSSPRNIPTILFGLLPWPNLPILPDLENKAAVSHFFGGVHGWLALVFSVLILGHVVAAMKHHFVSRDGILLSMAPSWSAKFLNRLRGMK